MSSIFCGRCLEDGRATLADYPSRRSTSLFGLIGPFLYEVVGFYFLQASIRSRPSRLGFLRIAAIVWSSSDRLLHLKPEERGVGSQTISGDATIVRSPSKIDGGREDTGWRPREWQNGSMLTHGGVGLHLNGRIAVSTSRIAFLKLLPSLENAADS